MKVIFKYSFKKEIAEAINMVFHFNDYKNLRSVVRPSPINIITFANKKKESINAIGEVWGKVSVQTEEIFKKYQLKDLENVTCYIHGISCEGWFDVDDNSIHVRLTKYGSEENLVDSIIHELLHLATYDNKLNYSQREAIVDNFLVQFNISLTRPNTRGRYLALYRPGGKNIPLRRLPPGRESNRSKGPRRTRGRQTVAILRHYIPGI